MTRALLALVLALPLAACGSRVNLPDEPGDGGTTESGPIDPAPVTECDRGACGPGVGAPAEICWDGSTGGHTGRCIRQPSGVCGWEYRACPAKPGSTCTKASECGGSFYCDVPTGACGGVGKCVAKPDGCDLLYAPVCGCDGKTYGNDCAAKLAGATVFYAGTCSPAPTGCGGGGACAPGLYCKYPDGMCPATGAAGSCAPRPEGCADIYQAVCGCDGKTYGNPCEAASAMQSIAYRGECADTPTASCGGMADSACPSSMYCDYPASSYCGGDDSSGVCRPRPTGCSKEYAPVCGCNRKTYSNACTANAAGVDVLKEGPC